MWKHVLSWKRQLRQPLEKKKINFDGPRTFGRAVQFFSPASPLEDPITPSSQFSWRYFLLMSILYAYFTEKAPFLPKFQAQKSSMCRVQDNPIIIDASIENKVFRIRVPFHEAEGASISSVSRRGASVVSEIIGRIKPFRGSQLCCHISVVVPSTIPLFRSCAKTSLPSVTNLQM